MTPRRRAWLWAMVVALLVAGSASALVPVEAGDSYCGTVLYDTATFAPCGSAMSWRRLLALACGAAAAALAVVLALSAAAAGRRLVRAAAVGLVGAAVVSALVVVNRLLQPTTSEWCGSVLNRHRTVEPSIEHRCDELLAPHAWAALGAGVLCCVLLVAGWFLWRRNQRQEQPR